MARSSASMAVICILSFLLVSGIFRVASGAITCGQVTTAFAPCISYTQGLSPLPQACCNGLQLLKTMTSTTPDRQAACSCLKTITGGILNLNPSLAAGLPGKCGVNVAFPIGTSSDCSNVHLVPWTDY